MGCKGGNLSCNMVAAKKNYNGFGTYSAGTSAAVGAEQRIVDLQPPLLQADPVGLHDK